MRELMALLGRYASVFGKVWKARKSLDAPERLRHEAEFLPAALALQETPVSPAPRVFVWLLIGFAAIALLWSIFGRIEIVAVAQGKIISSGRTKVIQPLEVGKIKAIHTVEGQQVKAGDPLIDLDATLPTADLTRITQDLTVARFDAARAMAFLDAVRGLKAGAVSPAGATPIAIAEASQRLRAELDEYFTKLSRLDAEILRHSAELSATQQVIGKLEQTTPLAQQRAGDYKNLLDKNFISRHGYLEKEQARIEMEGDLATQRAHLQEVEAALEASRSERAAFIAESARLRRDAMNEANVRVSQLLQEQKKADQQTRMTRLVAPVDGVVQQLAVHTIGGVVTPAQELMAIVPNEKSLEIEAYLENKDIGFVYPDQSATVKLETFPFTKYGTIPGRVSFVSNDAVTDEDKGLIYLARIQVGKTAMRVENKLVNLSPGMAVTVEIKTGSRRAIEYFLSPLLQYAQESMRER